MLDRAADRDGATPPPDWGLPRPAPDPDRGVSRTSLVTFLHTLRRRRWTLITTIIVIPLCAYIVLRQISPEYTATGSLIYEPSEYKARELESMLRSDPTTEAMMASQAEILQSLHVAEEVAKRGNLFANPAFNASLRPKSLWHRLVADLRATLGDDAADEPAEPVYGPVLDPTRDATLAAVQSALHAVPLHLSHVVEVTFTAPDPIVAAAAVNNAMDVYIKDQYAAKHRLVENATAVLEKQASALRREVRSVEEKMSSYRAAHGLSQGMHAGTETEEITHLTEDLVKARGEKAAADARLDAARGKAGAEAQAAVAPSVVALRAQQEQIAAQIQAQRTRLGSAHPDAQGLARQYADGERALAAEIARVVAATVAEQHAASRRVEDLEALLHQAETAAEKSAHDQIPLNAMARDLDAARGQLQAVLERIQQSAQQVNLESSEAHEITQALPPERPSAPHVMQAMAAAFVAAVFLGLLLVHILQLTDSTLHSGEEARYFTGLPCLALVPEVGKRALGHLHIHEYAARRPLTAFAEQVRALRAGLSLDIDHPQVVAITAARPSEGKSVLTLSLGRSAQLGGERVLAIECDVRQPSFQQRLGGTGQPGLLDILRGEVDWPSTVQEDTITGMSFIPGGKPGGDVLGLFLSDEMRQLLAEVRDSYDLVLLDAPPVEAMTETRVAAALADATLLCVRWRSTPRAVLMSTMDMLRDAHAKVIGTVLTRVDPRVHVRSGYADAGVYHRRYKSYYRG